MNGVAFNIHSEYCAGFLFGIVCIYRKFYTACFAASSNFYLRLDYNFSTDCRCRFKGFIFGSCYCASKNGYAMLFKEVTCLIFKEIHR